MNSINQLEQLHDLNSLPGLYIALLLAPHSKARLKSFCETTLNLDMTNSESPYEKRSHSTLFSSKDMKGKHVEDFNQYIENKQFSAKALGWDIHRSQDTGKRFLILKLECIDLVNFHESFIEKTGLSYSFSDYTPHISIHYDYKGEIPATLPDFNIVLQEMYSKPYYFTLPKKDNLQKFSNLAIDSLNNNLHKDVNSAMQELNNLSTIGTNEQSDDIIKTNTPNLADESKNNVSQKIQSLRESASLSAAQPNFIERRSKKR